MAAGTARGSVQVSLRLHTWAAKTVSLKLVEARDLSAANANGSSLSNPYATVELVDAATGKPLNPKKFKHTTATAKQSANPQWGAAWAFEGVAEDVGGVAVRVTVLDASSSRAGGDVLGGFTVPLAQGLGRGSHAQW
jgi:hypothetical protein